MLTYEDGGSAAGVGLGALECGQQAGTVPGQQPRHVTEYLLRLARQPGLTTVIAPAQYVINCRLSNSLILARFCILLLWIISAYK